MDCHTLLIYEIVFGRFDVRVVNHYESSLGLGDLCVEFFDFMKWPGIFVEHKILKVLGIEQV